MNFLFLTVFFPVLGFFLLICFQKLLSRAMISVIGIGGIALSGLVTFFIVIDFFHCSLVVNNIFSFIQPIFTWISVIDFCIPVTFRIDSLSLSMLVMIVGVSFLIHIYASWYMSYHVSYFLFFSYMNLFVANMIILILADNLLLMYFGWEGVGLCSYLLIGFYHTDSKHGSAALKSFIMTRIGDIFLICAMFMLYENFQTLDFGKLMLISSERFLDACPRLITFCLLVAAIAKSAQFPLQTWLSDAMVAPSPVSALIHAATMVTAGVYLISRTYYFFIITPEVLYLVGIVGSVTLIISSLSALVQEDIKKILAYSTMGQIGYMFVALSVQEREAAIFHLVMHSFFKSLLFLASGSLILFCRGEQNIFKMGGLLYKSFPLIYLSFLFGGASLSAIPIITSGFYSKGNILWKILLSDYYLFIFAGLFGSFITVLYTFRMIFVVFHRNDSNVVVYKKRSDSFLHDFPLLVLSILSTVIGALVKMPIFSGFLSTIDSYNSNKLMFEFFLNIIVIFGLCLSYIYYFSSYRLFIDKLLHGTTGRFFFECFFIGWGFDWLYKKIIIKPYLLIARLISFDLINIISNFIILTFDFFSKKLILSENGLLRYYVISMVFGMIIILLILLFL